MLRYLIAATSAAAAAAVLLAGTAAARPNDDPVSGDGRATAHPGNVVAADCAELFKGSTTIATNDFTYSVDGTNTYIDITAVASGVEVVAVVVKGGPAYNVYDAADLGALAWNDLHSPLVSSGEPAQISHWFACGMKTSKTTTTGTTGTETTTTDTSTTSSTESSSPTTATTTSAPNSSSGSVTTTTTTTSADVAAAADEDDLASTGFNGGWLIALALILLAGGGALLLIVRLRAARR